MTRPSNRVHGTRAKYVIDKCRCAECKAANNCSQRAYQRRKAQESWGSHQFFVDAEPVRQHVRALMSAGIGWKRIALLSGVSDGSISGLLYGTRTRPPASRVRPETARKLLSVTTDQAADGALVDGTGTRRRLQALVAVGWSGSELMRRLGRSPTNFGFLIAEHLVEARTARAVQDLYECIWNEQPPNGNRWLRVAIAKSRKQAAERGWLPPLAWDDETIDDPGQGPQQFESVDVDEVAVERCLAGKLGANVLTHAERVQVARRLRDEGRGAAALARMLGCSGSSARKLMAVA